MSMSTLKSAAKLLPLLLVAMLTFAACSDTSASGDEDPAAASADEDEATEAEEEEEEEEDTSDEEESASIDDVDTTADAVENPNTGEVSDVLVPQDGSVAVYEEHIRVLNDCDWVGLMAQYPNDAEIHLSDGVVIAGRQAIGDLFAGFVLPPEEGGLCGLNFVEQSRFEAGGTQNVHWEASADFLAEPYNGSDAYVSEGLYMDAMVTTFEGTDLVMADG